MFLKLPTIAWGMQKGLHVGGLWVGIDGANVKWAEIPQKRAGCASSLEMHTQGLGTVPTGDSLVDWV